MPDLRRRKCRHCGRADTEVGPISWSGLCAEDSAKLLEANIDGLHTKSGVPWQRWRLGQTRAVLGPEIANVLYKSGAFRVPLDDVQAKP